MKNSSNVNLTVIQNLSNLGVNFVACNNAMKAMGIEQKQLTPFVKIVLVGVLELIERQAEGYAYIKP